MFVDRIGVTFPMLLDKTCTWIFFTLRFTFFFDFYIHSWLPFPFLFFFFVIYRLAAGREKTVGN